LWEGKEQKSSQVSKETVLSLGFFVQGLSKRPVPGGPFNTGDSLLLIVDRSPEPA